MSSIVVSMELGAGSATVVFWKIVSWGHSVSCLAGSMGGRTVILCYFGTSSMPFSGEQNGDRSKRQLYWNIVILFLPSPPLFFLNPKEIQTCSMLWRKDWSDGLSCFCASLGEHCLVSFCLFVSFFIDLFFLAIHNEDYKLRISPDSSLDQNKPNGRMLLHEPSFWFCKCALALQLPVIISDLNIPTCGSCIIPF